MTHYLRFPSEATGLAALEATGLLTEGGFPITASHSHALDVIGAITDCNGWHVNYIGELPDEWDQYVVWPANPVRVWA
jgi:hypothetical protein